MAASCTTDGCLRLPQVKAPLKGFCCALCAVRSAEWHTKQCTMIEAVANAELGGEENIVLGYN